MAVDVKQYLEELYKEAGVSDDNVKQAVSNFFGNEKVSKRLADDVLRQADYSRSMDALKQDKQQWSDFYQKTLTTHQQNERVVNEYAEKVRQYEAQLGQLEGNEGKPLVAAVGLTKEQLAEELQKRDGNYLTLLKTGLKLATSHVHEFKEPLDIDTLEKTAIEKNISLQQAYDEIVKPKREAVTTAARTAEIAAAEQRGAMEFASKHKIPVDTKPREYHPLLDQDRTKQVEYDKGQLTARGEQALKAGFMEEWNRSGSGPGTSGA